MESNNDVLLKQAALERAVKLQELHTGKEFHSFQLAVFNAIFRDGKKRIFIRKGRKGGGTETILYPLVRIAGLDKNRSCYLIGPTQKLQSEIVWANRRLQSFIPNQWIEQTYEQEKRVRLKNGSFIKVEGADNPESARGWEGDVFIWDELKDHNPLSLEACYPNVLARDALWIVLGTPPTKKTNHYYILEQQIKNDPDWAFFHWTSWDNPFLPGGHEFLKAEKKKYYDRGDWDTWEIEYEARYVFNAKRKVIPNFTDKNKMSRLELMDIIKRDKHHLKWVTSIDPGYATCFAALFVCYNPYTNQLFRLDEIYSKNREDNSARDMYPLIQQKQKALFTGDWINIYDSAALSFAVEMQAIARDKGEKITLIPTKKQKNDEDMYFRVINSIYAQRGQSYTALECVNYMNEVENYETDENDNYPDADNHLLDNDRYIVKYLNIQPVLQNYTETSIIQPMTLKDRLLQEQNKKDIAGYGGFNANFSIRDI